ncbi:hypothetical protein ACOBQX_26275 [Actinokineospora sp. G85]
MTLVTDDGRFASIVTNTMAASAASLGLKMDVLKSAVCEGVA